MPSRSVQIDSRIPFHETVQLPALPSILRVLLVTDGTVTRTLEAYFGESIDVCVLAHAEVKSERCYPAIGITAGDPIIKRCVTLLGRSTQVTYAFAESVIVKSRLAMEIQRKLIEEKKGIGELLREGRLETYRDLLSVRKSKAGWWAAHLAVEHDESIMIRNYTIHIASQAVMEIEEVFPERPFENR